jgi:hypothetical protein
MNFSIVCSFKSVIDNFEWVFVGVYGPNDDVDKSFLWNELVGVIVVYWG